MKIPTKITKILFPSVVWTIENKSNSIYLTFDDGPTPIITDKTLSILDQYNAKATFFCLGDMVEKYPKLYGKIIENGHSVGNHTNNHLKGWITNNETYYKNIDSAAEKIKSNLFRPPYGKMKWKQYNYLKKQYKIVLWDIIPKDYSKNITTKKIVSNILKKAESGSIIVLHDSKKCAEVMLDALPIVLKKLTNKGFNFKAIEL